VGEQRLVVVGERESLVQGQQVVQVGRPAPPMPQHEQRRPPWQHLGVAPNDLTIPPVFDPPHHAVLRALRGDRHGPDQTPRRYVEAVVAQQPDPIAEGDPAQHPGTEPAEKRVTPCHARRLTRRRERVGRPEAPKETSRAVTRRGITDQHSTAGRAQSRFGITRTVPPGQSVAVRG
jgi:hypothetical protein